MWWQREKSLPPSGNSNLGCPVHITSHFTDKAIPAYDLRVDKYYVEGGWWLHSRGSGKRQCSYYQFTSLEWESGTSVCTCFSLLTLHKAFQSQSRDFFKSWCLQFLKQRIHDVPEVTETRAWMTDFVISMVQSFL
jgi:hypothetical protein